MDMIVKLKLIKNKGDIIMFFFFKKWKKAKEENNRLREDKEFLLARHREIQKKCAQLRQAQENTDKIYDRCAELKKQVEDLRLSNEILSAENERLSAQLATRCSGAVFDLILKTPIRKEEYRLW